MGLDPAVPARLESVHDPIDESPLRVLAGGAVALLAVATAIQFLREPFYVSPDSALFQHGGWYVTRGATPYVDFWDIKPPLIYAVTTPLALLAGGNMAALHVLSVLVALGAIAVGITAVGALNYRLTGDGVASVAAGLVTFVVPTLYTYPWAGIRPKYLAFCFVTLAVLAALEDHPLTSGAAAGVAAGFWQLAAPVGMLVVAIGWDRNGVGGGLRAVVGGGLVAALVCLPFVLTGNATALFVETVLAPFYGVEAYTLPGRVLAVIVELGYGTVLLPIGVYGWLDAIRTGHRAFRWVAVGGSVYLGCFLVEMAGAIDATLAVVFLALGLGHLLANASLPSRRMLLLGCVLLLVASNLYWTESGVSPVKDALEDLGESVDARSYASLPPDLEGVASMRTIYWERLRPDTCHYRLDRKQKAFVRATGGNLEEPTCGRWPFERPPVTWAIEKLVPG